MSSIEIHNEPVRSGWEADCEQLRHQLEYQWFEPWVRPLGDAELEALLPRINLPGVRLRQYGFVRCSVLGRTLVKREVWLCSKRIWRELAHAATAYRFREVGVDWLTGKGCLLVSSHILGPVATGASIGSGGVQ